MKKILIIGIGAGNPDHLTVQAINALNRVDVFFLMDKGHTKEKLVTARKEICDRYITHKDYRFAEAESPPLVIGMPDLQACVAALNREKQAVFEQFFAEEMTDGECGAFLVWGDPTLYDSTIRLVETIARSGRHELDYEVIPGISSVQALAARHRITLNQIGQAVEITTGRKIAEGLPDRADSVVVMLDPDDGFKRYVDQDLDIYWGAYVGTEDEILIAGNLRDVAAQIEHVRAEARRQHGWIMDSYILRRNKPQEQD
jgi:precorrin-6A synthase